MGGWGGGGGKKASENEPEKLLSVQWLNEDEILCCLF